MALSDGHAIAPGAWAVSLAALPDLRVTIPAGAAGRYDVSAALVAIDGGVIAEAKTALVVATGAMPVITAPNGFGADAASRQGNEPEFPRAISPPPPLAPPAPQRRSSEQDPNAPSSGGTTSNTLGFTSEAPGARAGPPALSPTDRKAAEGLLARGRSHLIEGNIASARLYFRRAAESGLADGALALAATFDPNELAKSQAIGIRADPAEARRWYEKAKELGAGAIVEERLARLGR